MLVCPTLRLWNSWFYPLVVSLWSLGDVNYMWTMGFCQVLSSQLSMEAMSFVTEDRKTAQESTFPNTYTFDLFGGVDVSLTFQVLMLCGCWTQGRWNLLPLENQLACVVELILCWLTALKAHFPVFLQLLVEILMRPTLTMQKKKPKSK